MIALDTNVVIRYLVQDDPRQSAVANRLIERTLTSGNPGFIPLVTVCEIAWVLETSYGADREHVRKAVEGLLVTKQFAVESSELIWKALRAWWGSSADLSDAIIGQVALARGAEKVVTFDKAAAKLPAFELLA